MERILLGEKMMSVFSNEDSQKYIKYLLLTQIVFFVILQILIFSSYKEISWLLALVFCLLIYSTFRIFYSYLKKEQDIIKNAELIIQAHLDGNRDIRIPSDKEGNIYSLFNSINQMASILNAKAMNETKNKEFLRDTISDISHQLKTPLAALNIYNELIYNEAEENSAIKELCKASESELDRLDILVKNILKIARLDAGMITLEKRLESIYDIIQDVELHFTYRAKLEGKSLIILGDKNIGLECDRDWIIEAINNIVKNAFDHTKKGDEIKLEWEQFSSSLQIKITDNGSGIYEEDLYHIFKRFYRSKHPDEKQGLGLGLPLAKSIVEIHGGTIEVFSECGYGTTFLLNFRNPTKL